MTLEELASKRSQFSLNDHTSPVLSRYLNSGSNTSHQTTDPLDAQKLSGSDREFHASRSASLLRSSSPFSGSEPETVRPSSARHTTKFSSNDWEPSVPFRPSFFITPPSISSPGSQYDPLRDSIEQPNILGGSFENSSYSRGASIPSTSHEQIFGDHALTGTLIPEYNADSSFPDKFHDNVLDKNNRSRRKDSFKTEAEAAGVSVSDWQNRNTVPKEGKLSGPSHVKDISRTNRIDIGRDRRHQSDGLKHKKESKVDRGRQNNEMDVDHKTDGDVHKEPKALRHFRAALVEFVKELLKPTWRDGHLSKDAHNMIVKEQLTRSLVHYSPTRSQVPWNQLSNIFLHPDLRFQNLLRDMLISTANLELPG
ncbi:hypothetical protein L1049_009619 [Liquidambar formosana]|uniref:Uncharacterized protein n=1 Tax=Liquidambar formosana TaxID=63359 RepID=A0AAP0N9W3_LIQFO